MKIVLYTNNCPKCKVLKDKLNKSQLQYEMVEDVELMINKGLSSMPVLEVDGEILGYVEAVGFVNKINQ